MQSNRQMLFLPYDGYIVRSIVQNVCARSRGVRQQNANCFSDNKKNKSILDDNDDDDQTFAFVYGDEEKRRESRVSWW